VAHAISHGGNHGLKISLSKACHKTLSFSKIHVIMIRPHACWAKSMQVLSPIKYAEVQVEDSIIESCEVV
jgi:hypothetical protein